MGRLQDITKRVIRLTQSSGHSQDNFRKAYLQALKDYEAEEGGKICTYVKLTYQSDNHIPR